MKRTIYLYGELAEKFVSKLTVNADSLSKAISALKANFKDFESYLISYQPGFHVRTGDIYRSCDTLHEPVGSGDIHIMPAVSGGSGKIGAFFSIIIGIALVFLAPPAGIGILSASTITAFGVGLIMAGISALLFAPPKPDGPSEAAENTPNTYFNGPVNTIAQGHPVPIGYGELIIGSAVISAGLTSVRI